jgi:hypothetical protein
MPELVPLDSANLWLDQVRRWLIDTAAFGKSPTPEQLENAAGKLAEVRRIYAEATRKQGR